MTALVLIAVGLFYVSIVEQTPDDMLYNVRRGVVAVIIVFILIGVIHMPDGPFVRPHPVVWRLVLCMLILYVLLLIFALFQVSHLSLSLSESLPLPPFLSPTLNFYDILYDHHTCGFHDATCAPILCRQAMIFVSF